MNETDAYNALSILIAGTTGWTDADQSVDLYAAEFMMLGDPVALRRACSTVARTWTEGRRPPLRTVIDTYQAELRRQPPPPDRQLAEGAYEQDRDVGRVLSRTVVPEMAEGIEIAREAFVAQCERDGKDPAKRMHIFDTWVATITRQRVPNTRTTPGRR